MIELFFSPGACSFVAHVSLEVVKAATGEDFKPNLVKLHKNEQKTAEYLAMNPDGQVPVLIVEGKPLTQIVAICDYLDRRFPQAKLLPTEAYGSFVCQQPRLHRPIQVSASKMPSTCFRRKTGLVPSLFHGPSSTMPPY